MKLFSILALALGLVGPLACFGQATLPFDTNFFKWSAGGKLQTIATGGALDTAFASSWNGDTTNAPTRNALYDYLHLFDTDDDGKINVLDLAAGLVKTDASGVVSTAVSGTDYAPATSGTAILKGNGSGGFANAVSGTDFQAALGFSPVNKAGDTMTGTLTVTGLTNTALTASRVMVSSATKVEGSVATTGIIKGDGTAATSGTDYAPATSGSSILKGNGSGGFSSATASTDYAPATSGSSILKGNGSGGFANAASGTDYAPATSGSSVLKGNGSGGTTTATAGTDYLSPATQFSLTHAGTVTLNLSALRSEADLSLTGAVTLATSNLSAGHAFTVFGKNPQTTNCAPTFPAGWTNWMGGAPSTITAQKSFVISVSARGATDSTVWTSYSEAP